MPLHLYYFYFPLCLRKEICGDQFSPLIARVSVLHAAGTPGGHVELVKIVLAFRWKHFLSITKWNSTSFVKPPTLTSEASVRSTVGLALVRKDFNYFNFYSID